MPLVWETVWAARLVATRDFTVFLAVAVLTQPAMRAGLLQCRDFGAVLAACNTAQLGDAAPLLARARALVCRVAADTA